MREYVKKVIKESVSLKMELFNSIDAIVELAERISSILHGGGVVYLFGNGGSAADAQHIAAELSGRFLLDRSSLPAVALTTNTSSITAIANDYGYEQVFSRQLEGLISSADMAVGITTSGRSKNVLEGLRIARARGAATAALVGECTEKIADYSDNIISIPSSNTARVQECHILVGHIICELVERKLFG